MSKNKNKNTTPWRIPMIAFSDKKMSGVDRGVE
jgi:hypothetical protein